MLKDQATIAALLAVGGLLGGLTSLARAGDDVVLVRAQ